MSTAQMTTPQMTAADVYQGAARACDELIRTISGEQWRAATPCQSWTVRDLVNHLVGENRWMPPLLAGCTFEEVGEQLDGDLLGDHPIRAWDTAREAARAAMESSNDHTRSVRVSFGDVPVDEYVMQVGADHLVHCWDLAIALRVDSTLDPDLVAKVSGWFADNESAYRAGGAVGPRPSLAREAGPQARLLAMFGRAEPLGEALEAVDRFGVAFDAKDVDAVMAAMTPDCVFESTAPPDGVRHQGQEQVRAAWTQFFADSAGAMFQTEDRFACGDRVVVHWRYDWAGDEPGHVRGVDIFRVENGLVAEKVSYVKG